MDSTPQRFASALKKQIPAVVVVACEEALDREEVGDEVIRIAQAAGFSERTVHHVERKDFKWHEITNDAGSMSLFSEKRIIEVRVPKALVNKNASEMLRDYVSDTPADTLLVVRTEYLNKRDRAAKWYQALSSVGLCIHAYFVKDEDLPRWIASRGKQQGVELTSDAVRFLADRLEGNLLAAAQEIARLKLMDHSPVTLEDVKASVSASNHYRMWDLLDAAFARQSNKVVRMCRSLAAEGESPIVVLNAVVSRLRSAPAVKTLGARRARALLGECAWIDLQAKGGLAGSSWQALERLLLGLGGMRTTPSLMASHKALDLYH